MTYDYQCDICDTVTEIIDHHSNSGLDRYCEICGSEMTRVYSVPALRIAPVFKAPQGAIEIGNEDPTAPTINREYNLTSEEINQYPELAKL